MKEQQMLRVGFVGAGAISQFHLRGWKDMETAQVVAICDIDREKAEEQAREFQVERVYQDMERMLDDEELDVVDIATPVGTHAPLTRTAADHGLHVMCQKPMTPTVAEAEDLIAYVGDRVRFMVHENYRWRPHYMLLRQWIAEGRIGEIQHARMTVRSASMVAPPGAIPFLLNRQPYLADFPRLLIFEVLIHHMDAMRAALGPLRVESVRTAKVNPDLAGEDVALIVLSGRDGLTALIDANISAMGYGPLPGDRFEVIGSEDTVIFDRDRVLLQSRPEEAVPQDLQANYQACFTNAVRNFVEGVTTGAAFATDRLDNLETLKLMEASYVAAGIPIE